MISHIMHTHTVLVAFASEFLLCAHRIEMISFRIFSRKCSGEHTHKYVRLTLSEYIDCEERHA